MYDAPPPPGSQPAPTYESADQSERISGPRLDAPPSPEHSHPATHHAVAATPGPLGWISRNKLSSALIAVIVVGLGIFGLVQIIGASAVTIRGTLEVDDFQGNCLTDAGFSDLTAGTQVVVTNASGSVVGTSALTYSTSRSAAQSSLQPGLSVCIYPFSVTGVKGGQSRYGVTISYRGTVWFTPKQITKPVGLNISSGGSGF